MKAMQVVIGVLIIGLAIAGYFFYFDVEPEPEAPTPQPTVQAPADKPVAPAKAGAKPSAFLSSEREMRDEDPSGDLQLEGQVLDADNLPVEGATVTVSSRPPQQKVTGKDGSFSFAELVGAGTA